MFLLLQELEELVKEKEKELEKTEERGNALIQDKKGVACSVVKETLKGLNQSWAHLDHMVGLLDFFFTFMVCCLNCALRHLYILSPIFLTDKSNESESAVGVGAVDVVPASFRGD